MSVRHVTCQPSMFTRLAASDDESFRDDAAELSASEHDLQSPVVAGRAAKGLSWPPEDGRAYAAVVIVSGLIHLFTFENADASDMGPNFNKCRRCC